MEGDDAMIEPLRTQKLAETIAAHIERLILEGVVRPGERLASERELAAKLDVSRPSLRDALGHAGGARPAGDRPATAPASPISSSP